MHFAIRAALCAAAFSAPPAAMASVVFVNGDFETQPDNSGKNVPDGSSVEFGSAGYANLAGWKVTHYNYSGTSYSTPFDIWWQASMAQSTSAYTQYGGTQTLISSSLNSAPSGSHFVSLDADPHAVGVLSQLITGLTTGYSYELTFSYAYTQMTTGGAGTSPNCAAGSGQYDANLFFGVGASALTSSAGAQQTGDQCLDRHVSTGWAKKTFDFRATSVDEYLSFLALGGPVGGPPLVLLDGITLTEVPEPASLSLLGGGVALGLAWRRAKRLRRTGA